MVGVCNIIKGEHDESCMSPINIHIKKEKIKGLLLGCSPDSVPGTSIEAIPPVAGK
jgi:hypothetical protein